MRARAVLYREGKIRATNVTFIFWDLFYPLGYLLVFGVGMTARDGLQPPGLGVDYNAFFLAGVLGMASFGIASNTAWSFFMDRDNGIFYEMLTYPMTRVAVPAGQGAVQPADRDGAGGDRPSFSPRFCSVSRSSVARLPLLLVGGARRDGRMVLLLRDLRAADPPQRRLQHRDVDLLLRVPVRELDVLSGRAAAVAVPRDRAGEPDHLARRRAALRHGRHRPPGLASD